VTQVLGGLEHAVGRRAVEDVERHQPGGRMDPELAEGTEVHADLVERGHVVGGQGEGLLARAR
jgi:hypothetical protein